MTMQYFDFLSDDIIVSFMLIIKAANKGRLLFAAFIGLSFISRFFVLIFIDIEYKLAEALISEGLRGLAFDSELF